MCTKAGHVFVCAIICLSSAVLLFVCLDFLERFFLNLRTCLRTAHGTFLSVHVSVSLSCLDSIGLLVASLRFHFYGRVKTIGFGFGSIECFYISFFLSWF